MKTIFGIIAAMMLWAGAAAAQTQVLAIAGPTQYMYSTANTSTTQLGAGATFTGTIESVLNEPAISIDLISDQPGTLTIFQYVTASPSSLVSTTVFPILAGVPFERSIIANGNFTNATFTNNGGSATTTFNLNIAYGSIQIGADTTLMVGGYTSETCVTPTVTASSAYTAGNEVGGLITFANAVGNIQTGILQAVRLNFKDAQTAEFDVTFFSSNPSASTWTDKSAPAINAADVFKVQPTIKLTNASSVLGTHTNYGQDGIGRTISLGSTSFYAVVTTPGTPTFASANDMQLCASILRDN
jgi:hypothetical protein